MVAGPVELEAGLEGDALERCTYRPAIYFQRAGRQPGRALRAGAAKLDGADDGAVCVDAPDRSRSVKAADLEQLAGDEAMGLVGAHLLGRARSCHEENDHQDRPDDQHSVPLFPTRQWSFINCLLSTFAVAA